MTVDDLERSAMQAARLNSPDLPSDLLDTFLYLALYSLYATLYAGHLTRPIKLKFISQYNQQKSSYDFDRKLRQSTIQLWRDSEAAGNDYARERTLDNADRLWAATLNLPEGSRPNEQRNQESG